MSLFKKKLKRINYSFVMGRLSDKIGGQFQYFPIEGWQKELEIGKRYGFDGVEWIISDYSNPIFNKLFLSDIKKNLNKKKMKICSLALDLIMKEPLYKIKYENLKWLIKKILYIQNNLKISRITFPIEETCRYRNQKEKYKSLKNLSLIIQKLSPKSLISIETDLSVKELKSIFKNKNFLKLGLLIDIGNLRALNRPLKTYFDLFPNRIYGIHIKYRGKNHGTSKNIPNKFNEMQILSEHFNEAPNLKDITFQTYRSKHNYLYDMKTNIKGFNENFFK
jgi:L-ribulose-5-phosphate 3-epimerase UlaE